jgi:hypothetical protein
MPPLAIMGGLALGGSIIGAVGAGKAAGAQSDAAKSAAQLQHQDQAASLAEQQRQFNIGQQNLSPFLKAGTSGINQLSSLLSTPGQGLLTPFSGSFQAPTAEQAAATPGYQFIAGAGSGAIQNSAAASGNLLSTGTMKTLSQFNQGLASTTYSDTYNRAFNEYLQQYNQFQNNQTNEFNRLASVSGLGQQAGTTLSNLGQQSAGNVANINAVGGAQQGANINLAGGATASGYAGIASALGGGFGNLSQLLMLKQAGLLGGGGGGGNQVPFSIPGDTTGQGIIDSAIGVPR